MISNHLDVSEGLPEIVGQIFEKTASHTPIRGCHRVLPFHGPSDRHGSLLAFPASGLDADAFCVTLMTALLFLVTPHFFSGKGSRPRFLEHWGVIAPNGKQRQGSVGTVRRILHEIFFRSV
jgi:hypothetical protein